MKIGIRKPNLKKMIIGATKARVVREAKKATIPFYNTKGMGILNDPKKKFYNVIYEKVTKKIL